MGEVGAAATPGEGEGEGEGDAEEATKTWVGIFGVVGIRDGEKKVMSGGGGGGGDVCKVLVSPWW